MIFWFGNIYDNIELKRFSYLSPAANKWQKDFIQAIKNKKKSIKTISYLDIKYWPFENIFFVKKKKSNIDLQYINFFFFKEVHLLLLFLINFFKYRSKNNNIIISYNFNNVIINTIKIIKFINNIKWYSIIADFDINKKILIENKIKNADLKIYLSNYAFQKTSFKNSKILLHGGIHYRNIKIKIKKKNILNFLYAGSLGNWVGIEKFLEDFIKLQSSNVRLFITSSSSAENIDKYIKKDKRIIFLGFLSEKKLFKLLKVIDVCINLRDLKNKDNSNNFPSKILLYLKNSKLILSDDNKSFSKCISNAVILNKKNDYQKILEKIINDYVHIYNLKKNFIKKAQTEMSWKRQINKISI
jgi:hypothetical protein